MVLCSFYFVNILTQFGAFVKYQKNKRAYHLRYTRKEEPWGYETAAHPRQTFAMGHAQDKGYYVHNIFPSKFLKECGGTSVKKFPHILVPVLILASSVRSRPPKNRMLPYRPCKGHRPRGTSPAHVPPDWHPRDRKIPCDTEWQRPRRASVAYSPR